MTAPRLATNARDASKTSRNKWVVLGACFAVNFISSALFRNAALFYPSIMDTFLVTRERAALPLFVYGGCFHLGALLGGTVIQVVTVWAAAVAGGLLLSATFIASSFANGTAFLTAVLGVLGGTGQGIIFNCSVVGLADYFSSRRGLALGVVMTGAPAASFIFPPIFDHALELYGLRGTLLCTGACMLNITAFALLLRSNPATSKEHDRRLRETAASATKHKSPCSEVYRTEKHGLPLGVCQSVDSLSGVSDQTSPAALLRSSHSVGTLDLGPTESSSILKCCPNNNLLFGTVSSLPRSGNVPFGTWPSQANRLLQKSHAELHDLLVSSVQELLPAQQTAAVHSVKAKHIQWQAAISQAHCSSRWTALRESAAAVATTPQFYVIAYSFWAYCFFLDTYLTVIVDYSADSGVAQSDAVHILSFFSVTDALCRLVIPLLSDCKVLSTTVLLAGSYLLVSVLAGGLAFLKGKIGFWIVALALGLPCGYINVGLSESLSAIAGAENLPMAIGFMSAAAAVGSFTTPSLIGLFRDTYGSYDDLFFIMAGALIVAFGLFAVLLVISLTRSKKVTVSR